MKWLNFILWSDFDVIYKGLFSFNIVQVTLSYNLGTQTTSQACSTSPLTSTWNDDDDTTVYVTSSLEPPPGHAPHSTEPLPPRDSPYPPASSPTDCSPTSPFRHIHPASIYTGSPQVHQWLSFLLYYISFAQINLLASAWSFMYWQLNLCSIYKPYHTIYEALVNNICDKYCEVFCHCDFFNWRNVRSLQKVTKYWPPTINIRWNLRQRESVLNHVMPLRSLNRRTLSSCIILGFHMWTALLNLDYKFQYGSNLKAESNEKHWFCLPLALLF